MLRKALIIVFSLFISQSSLLEVEFELEEVGVGDDKPLELVFVEPEELGELGKVDDELLESASPLCICPYSST